MAELLILNDVATQVSPMSRLITMVGLFSCNTELLQRLSEYLSAALSSQNSEVSGQPAPDYEPTHHKRQQLTVTKSEARKILQGYEVRKSTRELALGFGRSRATISNVLRKNGVAIRGLPQPTPEIIDEMQKLYRSGLSLEKVGKRVGFSAKTVHTYMRNMGVPMRDCYGSANR